MLNSRNNLEEEATQARVSTRELTEALASIEIRNARQAFDQAGTITLGAGIREYGIEATPEELQVEIEKIRETDKVKEKTLFQRRRLQLVLVSELVSAALCLLTLFGLQQTLFNKSWQQNHQAGVFEPQTNQVEADFQESLRQGVGPNAKYRVYVVPESTLSVINSGTSIRTRGAWNNALAYPLYCLSEGVDIHYHGSLDDSGHSSRTFTGIMPSTAFFEFREPREPPYNENVSVFYSGLQYWRGWIRRPDVVRLYRGQSFTLYPALVSCPRYKITDIVPLTVSMRSVQDAHGEKSVVLPECYSVVKFPGSQPVHLDEHAWEKYPNPFSGQQGNR